MKKIIIACTFILSNNSLYSQNCDSLSDAYNNKTIYRYGSGFMKGNERLTFKELSREFSMSDLGLDLYNKARKYKKTGTILNCAAILTGFAGAAVLGKGNNKNLGLALYGGYFVLFTTGMKYSALSKNTLDRALWLRNKDVLFPPRQ